MICILHSFQKDFLDKLIFILENLKLLMIIVFYLISNNYIYNKRDQAETAVIVRKNEDFRDLTELGRDTDD